MSDETETARTSLGQTLALRAEERQRERREMELRDMAAEQVEGILRSLIADPTAGHLQETILAGLIEGRPLPMPHAIRPGAGADASLVGLMDRLEAVATSLEASAARPRKDNPAEPASPPVRAAPAVSAAAEPLSVPPAQPRGRLPELFEAAARAPSAAPSAAIAPPPVARPVVPPAQDAVDRPARAGIGKPREGSRSDQFVSLVIGLAERLQRPFTAAEACAEARAEGFEMRSPKYADDLLAKYAIKFLVKGGEDFWWPSTRPLPERVPYTDAVLSRYAPSGAERVINNWNNAKTTDEAISYVERGNRGASAGDGDEEDDDAED